MRSDRTRKLEELNAALQIEISERSKTAERLQALLEEKEILLREIHHRVKNNLQVVQSLLKLQGNATGSSEMALFFEESRLRIRAMALVHEKLYQSSDLSQIQFREYIQSLAGNLFSAFGVSQERVALELDIENMLLPLGMAIPLGLISNELISNSLKHAFPGETKGVIQIRFSSAQERTPCFQMSDTGVGLPFNLTKNQKMSMGLQLVNTLVEQIGATLITGSGPGTTFLIQFLKTQPSSHLTPPVCPAQSDDFSQVTAFSLGVKNDRDLTLY